MVKIRKIESGFTLVELAIVIVIIGLLVGGVLQGKELVENAKLKNIYTQIMGYEAAINTFNAKYNCLPGDCINAFRFFDTACGTDSPIIKIVSNTGCNGDGNKLYTIAEGQEAWQHLSLAKMITGTYNGAYGNATYGTVVPASAFEGTGISIMHAGGDVYAPNPCGYTWCGYNTGYNTFKIGANTAPGFGIYEYMRYPTFTAYQMFKFDEKFDDGKFYSGVVSGGWNGVLCGIAPNYNLTETDKNCIIEYRINGTN